MNDAREIGQAPPAPPRVGAADAEQPQVGTRIGPMVWVPEIASRGPDDPWAHRKGEPRLFALYWAIYLMGAALLTIFAVRSATGPTIDQWVYGCRAMMLVTVVGVCVLWPLTRLSQVGPERPRRATLMDLLVLLLPAQVVLWPMPVLTGWTWAVTGGLALLLTGWALLIGVLVSWGTARHSSGARLGAMAWVLALLMIAPGAMIVVERFITPTAWALPQWWGLGSPFTASYMLTSETTGNLRPRMTGVEWASGLAPLGVGALGWLLLSRRPDGPASATGPRG